MSKKSLTSLLLVALFIVLASGPAQAVIRIDLNGNISQPTPSVLGDDDEQKEESDQEDEKEDDNDAEDEEDSSDEAKESSQQEEEKREAEKKEMERVREQLKKNLEQAKKIRETNREIVKKIEEKAKEDRQKSIEQIKLQSENSLKVLVASKSGEMEDLDEEEIEMETEDGVVSFRNSDDDDSIEITQGDLTARTDLPLSISPKTRKVSVEFEGKEMEVKVLPEEVLRLISEDQILNASGSGSLERFEIVVEDGQVVYLINGSKDEKFLGLFSVAIPKEIKVSGETGETLEAKQNFLSKILDLLSV